MLDWDELRSFLMIARLGTLSAAARALGVQQSTMGRRLDALEARTGARLLQRTQSGYVLTAAGEAVMGNIERMEAEALAVERTVTGKDVRLEGAIRLTTVETLAVEVLAPVFAAFRTAYPGISLDVMTDVRTLSLARREADVALRLARPGQQDLVARRASLLGVGLYASADYLAARGLPDWSVGAAGHQIVLPHDDLMGTPEMRWFAANAPHAVPALRSNSRSLQRAAAAAGIGVACLARYLGDGHQRLVRLPPPTPAPKRELWLVVHSDIRHMPRIRALTEFLTKAIRARSASLDPQD